MSPIHPRAASASVVLLTSLLVGATASAGPILYSVQSNGDDHLYGIDAATGIATDLGLLSFGDAEGLAFAGGQLYAIGGTEGQLWNITSPPGALVGNTGPRSGIDAGLDYDATTGTLYNRNSDGGSGTLYRIDLTNGAATLVGGDAIFTDGLAIDGFGNAYGIDGIFTDSLYSINLATGGATLIGSLNLGDISAQFGLTFAGSTLYALNSAGSIYTIDTATGLASFVNSTTCGGVACNGWEGLASEDTAPVPEPTTLALLGGGLVALRRLRRRSSR